MRILIRRRKTETVTVKYEFLRSCGPQEAVTAWCTQCGHDTRLMPPEDVALLTGVSAREIYRRVEVGVIHFTELAKGGLLVCLNSVAHKVPAYGIDRLG
jgi:hypothetical protein